jgi:hypothetical protein
LDTFPEFQFVLYEAETQEVLAEGHTLPCHWDGTSDGLGDGIDAMLVSAFQAHEDGLAPTALGALAAEIRPRFQGRGLANRMLDVMADLGRNAGLPHLIAPVRPSLKDRYPITPIERYVTWTRENGEPLTRGFGSTPAAVPRSSGQSRSRCPSGARSVNGKSGPACDSPTTGITPFPPVSPLSKSTIDGISAPTGSRTSGSFTRSSETPA